MSEEIFFLFINSYLLIDIVGLVIFKVELSILQREMMYLQYFYNKS